MVGVPGRSKACNTCRARRIACGLERPECVQCTRSNRVCMGYQRERVFLPIRGNCKDGSETYARKSSDQRDRRLALSPKRKQHNHAGIPALSQPILPKTISSYLAYRQQLLSNFPSRGVQVTWLRRLVGSATNSRALETSLLALCTSRTGRKNDDATLVHESLNFYVQGLSELQRALWNTELIFADETLAACMVLSLYEAFECPEKTRYGWLNHKNGCARLIKLRGPDAHCEGLGHELFLSFRLREILQAIIRRSSTFLAAPDWTQLPWKYSSKTPFHQLLDIMADLPRLLEQGCNIKRSKSPSRLLAALQVIKQCQEVGAQLSEFFRKFEHSSVGPLYWPELSKRENPADDTELGKVFPVAFHFPNQQTAHVIMLYWASLLMLLSGLSLMHRLAARMQHSLRASDVLESTLGHGQTKEPRLDEIPRRNDGTQKSCATNLTAKHHLLLSHGHDIISLSRNICQSTEYCLRDELGDFGVSMTYFPLKVAIKALNHYPRCHRELFWAKAVMENMNMRSGMRILRCGSSGGMENSFVPGPPEMRRARMNG